MEQGIIWRIGDGSSVWIWEDPWIPAGLSRRLRTPRGNTLLTKVSELIDPVTSSWDVQLVKDLFWEEDVVNILAIPMHTERDDIVAWHFDTKGCFSIKSAYHVLEDRAENMRVRQRGEASSIANNPPREMASKKIWKVPAVPKIRQFLWRVAHNSLAFKLNISRRGVKLDTRCPVCYRFDEDGAHCFMKCKAVRQCWRELAIDDIQLRLLKEHSAQEFINAILNLRSDT